MPVAPLDGHLVGELIASEVEIRTGRCETFAEAAAPVPVEILTPENPFERD